MARLIAGVILGTALLATLVPATQANDTARWIVQLKPGGKVGALVSDARMHLGVHAGMRFDHLIHGFSATMTRGQRDALAADARVEAIVPDAPIQAAGDPYPSNANEVQPGIRRVGAPSNADRAAKALDVDIAVLDTGIQPDNTELNVVGGYNCTDPSQPEAQRSQPSSWRDSATFGHGTHVAGIAAAIENGRGVAGVAQGARLWAIKVLNSSGNGYWSWVICGLDHVAAMRDPNDSSVPRIEVVNMSIAGAGSDDGDCGYTNADLFHQAVCALSDAGVTMVAAAGNEHANAAGYIPGAYDEVITVSAMADWNGQASGSGSPPSNCGYNTVDDGFASFSDFGADVDLIAPGVCVLSTLPTDRLGRMSGTSMATPHVTGGAALYYLAEARLGRPRPTPQDVRAGLIAAGTHDWRTDTDPDRNSTHAAREPALQVSQLDALAPAFSLGTRRQTIRVAAGASATTSIWIARIGGFSGSISVSVAKSTLPQGASATLSGHASVAIDVPSDAPIGSYDVTLDAVGGALTASTHFRLIVFGTASDASGPTVQLRSGVTADHVLLPGRVRWPSVSHATRYQVQQSVDAGAWTGLAKTAKHGLNVGLWPGRRYQFRVRAKVGGTWQAWHTGPSVVGLAFEPSSAIDFTGDWQTASIKGAYSELPVYSTDAGATATFTFSGRSIAWLATRGPTRGEATVTIDGSVTKVSLYAAKKQDRRVVFSRAWSDSGPHTLVIEVLGRPLDRPRVDIDALAIVAD